MAWPPPIPPNTRQNTTPELDNHPSDHNLISNALTEISSRVVIAHGAAAVASVSIAAAWTTVQSITIAPVTVPSRLFIWGNLFAWGAALTNYMGQITDPGLTTALFQTPTLQAPTNIAAALPLTAGLDIAANANPSFVVRAQVIAGGGSNFAQSQTTWLLVAR